jgi:CDP-diacylglycerol--serine O-phosphatidyltransferase
MIKRPRKKQVEESNLQHHQKSEELFHVNRLPRLQRLSRHIPKRLKVSPERLGSISFLLPNLTTVMALCMGLSAVRFALLDRWEFALGAILIAAILDGMDGRIARLLNSTSRFGAELDSLSDFISFGVSPALIVYFKSLHQWGGYGWLFVLYFSVCMALRLARFNTMSIEGTSPAWSANYFVGTPAPAAAILALTPIMIDIEFNLAVTKAPLAHALTLFVVGSLAISRIPTFSFKKSRINPKHIVPFLIGGAMALGFLFTEPWLTLSLISIGYIGLIPLSIRSFKQTEKAVTQGKTNEL